MEHEIDIAEHRARIETRRHLLLVASLLQGGVLTRLSVEKYFGVSDSAGIRYLDVIEDYIPGVVSELDGKRHTWAWHGVDRPRRAGVAPLYWFERFALRLARGLLSTTPGSPIVDSLRQIFDRAEHREHHPLSEDDLRRNPRPWSSTIFECRPPLSTANLA